MIYTIKEIEEILLPICEKYKVKEMYIFGSYAKGYATEESDVDILIDRDDSEIKSLLDLSGFYIDCEEALNKKVDIVTLQALEQKETKEISFIFINNIMKERIKIYDRERLSNSDTCKKAL